MKIYYIAGITFISVYLALGNGLLRKLVQVLHPILVKDFSRVLSHL
jgi:hypothetical protein